KVAFVTGGGSGLGAATSEILAEAGARVVVADLRPEAAERVARGLEERSGGHLPLTLDVRDAASVESAIDAITTTCGRLDILVNNAGTDVTLPVDELSVE